MVARKTLDEEPQVRNVYFAKEKDLEFFSSGCLVQDLALGGGWAERRIANVVGDRSTGKTLIAIEAMTNFSRKHPKGKIKYRETEHAFDPHYAAALGLPLERIDFGGGKHSLEAVSRLETVEDLFEDIEQAIEKAKEPTYYVVDSLDALSDRAEATRKIDAASFGTDKAKLLSRLFREHTAHLARKDVTLLIVSQTRANVNKLAYGKDWVRGGGKALDFYSSQVLFLKQIGMVIREVQKIKRPTGIKIETRMEKNKVSLPFRRAEFEITFGYGMDDHKAAVMWLNNNVGVKPFNGLKPAEVTAAMHSGDREWIEYIRQQTTEHWYRIEQSFMPAKGKYQ